MLNATAKILASSPKSLTCQSLDALLNLVVKFGSHTDAEALYQLFLLTKDETLLDVIMVHGTEAIRDDLFQKAIVNGSLTPTFPSKTLVALSYLQHPALESMLICWYKNLFADGDNWDFHVHVCEALMNYSCSSYRDEIQNEVEKCLQQRLFMDMIPVIAYKLNNPHLNGRILHHMLDVASTSAVSGMLLSTALAGAVDKEGLRALIWNKDLEATYTGIGNTYYTYLSMQVMNLSISDLHHDLTLAIAEVKPDVEYRLFVLEDLLEMKLKMPVFLPIIGFTPLKETYETLYRLFFQSIDQRGADETITRLIAKYAKSSPTFREELFKERFSRLDELYALKIEAEIQTEFMQASLV